jgi:hypothetical protein
VARGKERQPDKWPLPALFPSSLRLPLPPPARHRAGERDRNGKSPLMIIRSANVPVKPQQPEPTLARSSRFHIIADLSAPLDALFFIRPSASLRHSADKDNDKDRVRTRGQAIALRASAAIFGKFACSRLRQRSRKTRLK